MIPVCPPDNPELHPSLQALKEKKKKIYIYIYIHTQIYKLLLKITLSQHTVYVSKKPDSLSPPGLAPQRPFLCGSSVFCSPLAHLVNTSASGWMLLSRLTHNYRLCTLSTADKYEALARPKLSTSSSCQTTPHQKNQEGLTPFFFIV